MLARDVFSLLHFPMVGGIIAYAVAIEEMAEHPSEPLAFTGRLSLALGLVLFVGGMAVAMLRATCGRLLPRAILTTAAAVAILGIPGAPPLVALAIAFGSIWLLAALEQRGRSPEG
jgi:low temperature requirement protein LtrA